MTYDEECYCPTCDNALQLDGTCRPCVKDRALRDANRAIRKFLLDNAVGAKVSKARWADLDVAAMKAETATFE